MGMVVSFGKGKKSNQRVGVTSLAPPSSTLIAMEVTNSPFAVSCSISDP